MRQHPSRAGRRRRPGRVVLPRALPQGMWALPPRPGRLAPTRPSPRGEGSLSSRDQRSMYVLAQSSDKLPEWQATRRDNCESA